MLLCTSISLHGQIRICSSADSTAVEGAELFLFGSKKKYFSDESGKINLVFTSDSSLKARITHHGFVSVDCIVTPGFTVYIKPSVNQFDSFVFTVSPHEKKVNRDVLAHVSVIKPAVISSTGSQNLGDIMRYQTNVRLNYDPVLGTSLNLNGMGGQNVKILKNGANLSGNMNGSIDVSQINIAQIEQIEIIEGPMSLLYGSSALAGTINVIGKLPGRSKGILLKTFTESSGIYNFSASVNGKFKKTDAVLSVARNFFDGWNPGNSWFAPMNQVADSGRYSLWKPRQQLNGDLAFRIPVGKNAELKLSADNMYERIISRGRPMLPYNESAFDDYFTTYRNLNIIELNVKKGKLKHHVFLSGSYFYRTKNTFLKDLTSMGKGVMTASSSQDTTIILSSQLRYISGIKSGKFRYDWGIDGQHEMFTGKKVEEAHKAIYSVSGILVASYSLNKKNEIKAGIRQSLHSRSNIPLIPSFQYRRLMKRDFILKTSVARGFRTPGVKELYLYFVDINHNIKGNESLQSESSWNYDVSLQKKKKFSKQKSAGFQIYGYVNQVKNLINLAAISLTEYTYQNIGVFKSRGVNTDLFYNFRKTELSFKSTLLFVSGSQDPEHLHYNRSFNHAVSAKIPLLRRKELYLNTFINRYGKSTVFGFGEINPVPVQMDPYTMTDISLSWKARKAKTGLLFTGGIKNLHNIDNINTSVGNGTAHSSSAGNRIISTGRTVFFSIELTL